VTTQAVIASEAKQSPCCKEEIASSQKTLLAMTQAERLPVGVIQHPGEDKEEDDVSFREALRSGKFVVTMDAMPPKGTDLTRMLRALEGVRGRVDGVNAPEMPSAVMRLGSLPVCHILLENDFEPILQMCFTSSTISSFDPKVKVWPQSIFPNRIRS